MFDFSKNTVYFRDKFMPFNEATISIANTGFMYGLGVFTGIRAHYNAEEDQVYLFRPETHYQRFYKASQMCQFNQFTDNYTYERFRDAVVELIRINTIKEDAYVRITQFVDEQSIGVKFTDYKDAISMFLYPLGDYVPTGGMKCKVVSWQRVKDNAIPSRGKIVGAYVNTAFAKTEAIMEGYDEAIVLDDAGHAVEGSAENLFIVRDNVIITPPTNSDILEGITRDTVMKLATNAGYKVVERSIDRTELYFADEVFLTGTGARVSPVTQIDHVQVNGGTVGPIAQRLQILYSELVIGKHSQYEHWLVPVY